MTAWTGDFAGWPKAYHPETYYTAQGALYLTEPGVVLVSQPEIVDLAILQEFLDGFPTDLGFDSYTDDPHRDELKDGELLSKLAGQLCYLSFGPKRTMDDKAGEYFRRLLESGHGSVLEHLQYSLLFYGISRSLTHELVRHRAGFAYSQVSQRYVDGGKLRFVERPEFQADPALHQEFEERIDQAVETYEAIADRRAQQLRMIPETSHLTKTDLRKMCNQVARACLPNETEAPILTSANMRAWRHFFNMRGSIHAETEIRRLAVRVFEILQQCAPLLLQDFEVVPLADGTRGLSCKWPKV